MISSSDEEDIVLTSRVRLARNLRDRPFPGWAKRRERAAVFEQTMAAARDLTSMKRGYTAEMSELNQVQKQILVERHLISRDLAARAEGCGIAVSHNKTLSIMLNEEDHLRIQFILPGQQLRKAWSSVDKIDSALEERLPYAFHEQFGYLTACPSNLGTGMRASAMLHLPGIVLSGYMEQVLKSALVLNLTIRGIYGEGTQGLGNFFQISNQATLGESEEQIIERLRRFINDLARQEGNARRRLYEQNSGLIADRIGRAYGVLRHSLMMSTKEALEHISMVRLGVSLGFFGRDILDGLTGLVLTIQAAHMQYVPGGTPGESQVNDVKRASAIREHFKTISEPCFARVYKNNQII